MRVRLWIDDLSSLARLQPAIRPIDHQHVDGVNVCRWREPFAETTPAQIVIEAFGCGLPDMYVSAMANACERPLWVIFEYLSAERWVPEHHGRPSPHPRLPLERYFFFPGFESATGGLLRERDLFERRDAFGPAGVDAFWNGVGFATPPAQALTASIYAYDVAPLSELLDCWIESERPIVASLPEGPLVRSIERHFSTGNIPARSSVHRGALEVRVLPFVPQADYDELLWASDCNFVRGEDTFVRAQWAARPFVWHVYPQADRAHWVKLESFLDVYCETMQARTRSAAVDLMRLWNQYEVPGVTVGSAWCAFAAELDRLRNHGRAWAERTAQIGSLTDHLASFCLSKLK